MKLFIISLFICSCLMTVVSIAYMAISSSLKNWSAKRRYNLWLIILLGFLTPIKPFVSDHIWKITLKTETSNMVNNMTYVNPDDFQASFDLTKILFVLWLIGAIFFAVKSLVSHYKFKNYLSRYSEPCDTDISDIKDTVAKELNIKNVNVVKLKGINSPMMIGLRQATIILPERDYLSEELRLIIKHELYHYKKYDLLYKALFLICKMVHWFNPIMAVIEREMESVCELACDERVIHNESKNERKTYCHAILNSASPKKEEETLTPILSSNFVNDKNDLKHRLALIITNTKKKRFTFISAVVILLTVLSGTVFGVAYDDTDVLYSGNEKVYETTTVVYIPEEEPTSIPMVTDQQGNTMARDQNGNFLVHGEGTTAWIHLEETTLVEYSAQEYENTEPAYPAFTEQSTNRYRSTTVTDKNQ